jgi:hypothetical protein
MLTLVQDEMSGTTAAVSLEIRTMRRCVNRVKLSMSAFVLLKLDVVTC